MLIRQRSATILRPDLQTPSPRPTGLQTVYIPFQDPHLSLPHAVEDVTAVQLGRAEGAVQDGRDDLEGELPPGPEGAEEVEDDEGFGQGAEEGGGGGEAEEAGEEEGAGGVEAVEDDGDVGEEFADDVEGAWF